MTVHPIPPVYDENSEILILGSFPSVKSREEAFFYAHPGNRFWKTLAYIKNEEIPVSINEKKAFLLRNKIALWDVIASCDVKGSSDSSIKNAVPNDFTEILEISHIKKIFLNGRTAEKYYIKYLSDKISLPFMCLPSTSPANAAVKADRLIEEWSVINLI